jgi:hypothetical protein
MKIINKQAINFDENQDWFADDTLEELKEYESEANDGFEFYDAEANSEDLVSEDLVFEIYDDEDIEQKYLADNFVQDEDYQQKQEPIEGLPQEKDIPEGEPYVGTREEAEIYDEVDETVAEKTEPDEDMPEFATVKEAIQAAIDGNRVLEIFYVTEGRGSRKKDKFLKRERGLKRNNGGGVNIHRIVEPHYMYTAEGSGNLVVVTYDRSIGRGAIQHGGVESNIRAYIVKNIYDYNFTKNRKTKKDQYFKPKIKIMTGSNKGIKTMENTQSELIKIASTLEDKGLKKSSSIVRNAEKILANFKMAQYVGVQGYWLKNRRCWDNCYRHKRTTQPDTPAQKVWMECWDEYKNSINNNKSSWAKYAGQDSSIKISAKEEAEWNKIFASKVEAKIKEGLNRPEAVYTIIEAESQDYTEKILEASADLMTLSEALVENNQQDLGLKLAELSEEMLKEAEIEGENSGFFGRMKQKAKDWWGGKGTKADVVKKIQNIIGRANELLYQLNFYKNINQRQANSDGIKKIVIEAQNAAQSAMDLVNKRDPYKKDTPPQQTQEDITPPLTSDNTKNNPVKNYRFLDDSYLKFLNDVSGIIKEFSGLQQSQDPQVAQYTRGAIPLLQNFVGNGSQLRKMPPGTEQRETLRNTLQQLIINLQGILSGQNQSVEPIGLSQQSPQAQGLPQQAQSFQQAPPAMADINQGLNNISQYIKQEAGNSSAVIRNLTAVLGTFKQNNVPFNEETVSSLIQKLNTPQ